MTASPGSRILAAFRRRPLGTGPVVRATTGGPALRNRLLAALATVLLVGAPTGDVRAWWARPEEIVEGSAYTFERGTFSMGVYSPLQYGATDWLMLSTHPILHLLLTPNVNVRARALEWPVALSLQAGYQQTFLDERGGGFPGTAHGEVLVSRSLGGRVVLTALAGYAWGITPSDHRIQVGGTVHVLLGRADLLMAQVSELYSATRSEWERPSGLLFYAHAWHMFHLGAGLAVGRFSFLPWEDVSFDAGGVPLYPVIDAWWRL